MSWRSIRDRFLRRNVAHDGYASAPRGAPAPGADESRIAAAMRSAAEAYVEQHLPEGAKIIEEIDGPIISQFRGWIPGFLARKGLALTSIPGGWRVERSRFPALAAVSAECDECHGSWFRCGHGVGLHFHVATKE